MAEAKVLGWRDSDGGEPQSGIRLCSTHRLVSLSRIYKFQKIRQRQQTCSDVAVDSIPAVSLA